MGDLVWSKDQSDANAPMELKPVIRIFRRTAYDLQTVSVRDENGNVEVIHATDEHPFYVEGRGWAGAVSLRVGEHLVSPDGGDLVVVGNVDEKHPEGIAVFNFEVEGDHTYFVEDGVGYSNFIWVHNACTPTPKMLAQMEKSGLPYQKGSFPFKPKSKGTGADQQLLKRTITSGPKAGKKGYVDEEGRIWIKDRAHAGDPDHWDVQIDGGADYVRVDLDGNPMP